ncbi:hypothetical protein [Roseovarius salincola]|nr:hypothetical protein [Roseovarius sp. EGI FJ00037]
MLDAGLNRFLPLVAISGNFQGFVITQFIAVITKQNILDSACLKRINAGHENGAPAGAPR